MFFFRNFSKKLLFGTRYEKSKQNKKVEKSKMFSKIIIKNKGKILNSIFERNESGSESCNQNENKERIFCKNPRSVLPNINLDSAIFFPSKGKTEKIEGNSTEDKMKMAEKQLNAKKEYFAKWWKGIFFFFVGFD